jgi:uncharacterized membrane protein
MIRKSDVLMTIQDIIIKIINEYSPTSNFEVLNIAQKLYNISEEDAIKALLVLKKDKKITFINRNKETITTLTSFLLSKKSNWYKITLLISIISLLSSLLLNSNTSLVYLRYFFGFIMIFFIPGYSILILIGLSNETDEIYLLTFSIGISIIVVSVISLVLNFSPFKMSYLSIIFSLFGITFLSLNSGLLMEYQKMKTNDR